eukprot:403357117
MHKFQQQKDKYMEKTYNIDSFDQTHWSPDRNQVRFFQVFEMYYIPQGKKRRISIRQCQRRKTPHQLPFLQLNPILLMAVKLSLQYPKTVHELQLGIRISKAHLQLHSSLSYEIYSVIFVQQKTSSTRLQACIDVTGKLKTPCTEQAQNSVSDPKGGLVYEQQQ